MTHEEFKIILQKYRKNTCTPEERRLIDEWYASIGSGDEIFMSEEEEERLGTRYWSAVNLHIQKQKKAAPLGTSRSRPVFTIRNLRVAAVVATVLLTFGLFQLGTKKRGPATAYFQETVPYMKYISNYGGKPMEVKLPDGSKVVLEDSGRICYTATFTGAKREVYLQGVAFFEVTHDVHRPFLVYAGEITTQVHGTSFTVTARPGDKRIIVAVRTGKVSVFIPRKNVLFRKGQSETILTPNQEVVYDRSENITSKTLVRAPQPVISAEEIQRIRFEEAPVGEIFKTLQKMYGVEIVFDAETFRKCVLTTTTSDEGIFKRMDIICKAIGATYTVENTEIIIHGSGCK